MQKQLCSVRSQNAEHHRTACCTEEEIHDTEKLAELGYPQSQLRDKFKKDKKDHISVKDNSLLGHTNVKKLDIICEMSDYK